jgi:hypothetical protein
MVFTNSLRKELLKIIYYRREKQLYLEKHEQKSVFEESMRELISLVKIRVDNLPRVLPIVDLLFDYLIPSEVDSKIDHLINQYLKVNLENEELFKLFIQTDLQMFYKLKKIAKQIEIRQLDLEIETQRNLKILKYSYFFTQLDQ